MAHTYSMHHFLRNACLLFFLVTVSAGATTFHAFGDGEKLVYRVGWGVLTGAGQITIAARAESGEGGKPLMRITLTTESKGIVRGVYKYESVAEVLLEQETGRLLWAKEVGNNRGKPVDSRTDFDYAANIARHRDVHRPGRNRDLVLKPEIIPVDLVSTLVATRSWNLKPGDARDVVVFAGRDLFPVTVHAEALENVKTALGEFQTLVLVPRMEKEEPRGIFKRGGAVKVWIAQKEPFLPVQMRLELNFGKATLTLIEHQPPTTPRAPADAAQTETKPAEAESKH